MATTADLLTLGFERCEVAATRLGIVHPDPTGLGPFCRLDVTTAAPASAGVYAWVVGDEVRYVGKASFLLHIVKGQRHQRAYNDYTYVPASKVASQPNSPRVRVNGLLNRALTDGETVTWWWLSAPTPDEADLLERRLINQWGKPAWNKAVPTLR